MVAEYSNCDLMKKGLRFQDARWFVVMIGDCLVLWLLEDVVYRFQFLQEVDYLFGLV